jgi:hypothetical protein
MNEPHDYELGHEYEELPPPAIPPQSYAWPIAVVLAGVAVAVGVYFTFAHRPLPPPLATEAPRKPAADPVRPLGGEAQPIPIPPLAESDPTVRMLVEALSSHPLVAAYLATNGLIRNFTAAVSNIAEGASPAKQLSALRPREPFRTTGAGSRSYIDTRSYDRYTKVADAVASIDPVGAARLYATLKPRIEEAADELGTPPGQFDRVLEQAIVALLMTPTPDRAPEVTPNVEGIGYGFADGRLEGLSTPQKALVRMGPANERTVKARLRDIALALGIPPSRLPSR